MIKKMISVLVGTALVATAGVASIQIFIDPNDFKPFIIEKMKESTGRDLQINGDIDWQFFPLLDSVLKPLHSKNPEGFQKKIFFT